MLISLRFACNCDFSDCCLFSIRFQSLVSIEYEEMCSEIILMIGGTKIGACRFRSHTVAFVNVLVLFDFHLVCRYG